MDYHQLEKAVFDKIRNEMPVIYTYHGLHHTEYVLKVCENYIEMLDLSNEDAIILKTAAILHDVGLIWNYNDHEYAGILYVKEILFDWGFHHDDINQICKMIAATKIPQEPSDLLSQILCDADLDYLGTSLFEEISSTLYQEFLNVSIVKNVSEYDDIQIRFLSNHRYHTDFAKENREPIKQTHLMKLIKKKQLSAL